MGGKYFKKMGLIDFEILGSKTGKHTDKIKCKFSNFGYCSFAKQPGLKCDGTPKDKINCPLWK